MLNKIYSDKRSLLDVLIAVSVNIGLLLQWVVKTYYFNRLINSFEDKSLSPFKRVKLSQYSALPHPLSLSARGLSKN